mmetsp:Transcript_4701/g.13388  ORF Transcript_4701/g.13388 Transcript_4701/m.13388 type:complete len:221 (+) Transcript_4701:1618-2280(+)
MPTLRTRKLVETLAPWNAAPRAGASSPLRWRPSSSGSDLFVRPAAKKSRSISWIFGTRTPPPMISTPCRSSTVAFALASASCTGCIALASTSAAAASKSLRVTIMWKSMSSCRDGMLTGIFSFALRTSLVFLALARIFAIGRAKVRTSPALPFFFFFHCSLNASAIVSARARSTWKPPAPRAQPLPRTSNWPMVLFLTLVPSTKVEYSTTDAWIDSEPAL